MSPKGPRGLNINLSESQWLQSTLSIGMGGLGIRRVLSLALPAFLASAAGTLELQSNLLKSLVAIQTQTWRNYWRCGRRNLGSTSQETFPLTYSQNGTSHYCRRHPQIYFIL